MRAVTWILRIISITTFVYMAWLVYNALAGYWDWDAPYLFIITVFHLLCLVIFFLAVMIINGLAGVFLGGVAINDLLVGLYNTIILRMWYMQPYGVHSPLTNMQEVFTMFMIDIETVVWALWGYMFTFLYFLFAAIGVALFLQSIVRMEHKYVGGAFLSIQCILVVAAFQHVLIPEFNPFPSDFIVFLTHSAQVLALISFLYLESSYQMIYSYSVGKPVEDREETLKRQLLALRHATRKQDALERGDKITLTAMSRKSGATAFSFLREAIERKAVGSKDALENLDAISDVRRLQHYVDELLLNDPKAREELTARAASPSAGFVISSALIGSVFRTIVVIALSFVLMSPDIFIAILNLPIGIENSVEIQQAEFILIFLVPVIFLFPFISMAISWVSQREDVEQKPKLTETEKEEFQLKKKELDLKKKEAARIRKERKKAKKKRKTKDEEGDEWDKALEETFKR